MTTPRGFSPSLTAAERGRVDHVDRLVAQGRDGIAELIAMMADTSWTVRRGVVAGLAALGDDAVAPLATWLRTERTSEHAIAAAVDALVASSGAGTTAAMIALLDDARAAVAADGATVLGRRRAVDAIPALSRALAHADDNVAVATIEALGTIGGVGAVDALIAVLAQRNFFRTFPAIQVLARTGDPRVVGPLASLLADDSHRFDAARALGHTGFAQAIRPLAALLPRADAGGDAGGGAAMRGADAVRLVAVAFADLLARAEWLGAVAHVVDTLRATIAPTLATFASALAGADVAERIAIATVLGCVGDATVLPELARLLDDADVRVAATDAIRRIGQSHDDALIGALTSADPATRAAVLPIVHTLRAAPSVRALLAEDDPEMRARACEALARIGDTTAVPALFAALADASPRVAHAATAAIHSLGVADTAARTIEALRHGSLAVRRHALRIVAYMGFEVAFEAVVVAIADADARIAELAVGALAMLSDTRVDATLTVLAADPREGVRAATMRAAGQRGGPFAVDLLARGVRDDAAWVRYFACQGLGRLREVSATPLVIGLLADAVPHVQIAAIEALGHLDSADAWDALVGAGRSTDPERHRAALASMSLRPRDQALPFLLAGARADDVATRLIALTGLAGRAEPDALAALAHAALHEVADVRDAALSLFGDRADATAAAALVEIALASAPDHPAQRALSTRGEARVAAIAARLPTADVRTASLLVVALARMQETRATAMLFDALALDNVAVRRAAASSLVALGRAPARAALARLAKDDPDLEVRRIAATASAE